MDFSLLRPIKILRNFVIHARVEDLVKQMPQARWNEIYDGVPLSNISGKYRGDILENWAKHIDPHASDASRGHFTQW